MSENMQTCPSCSEKVPIEYVTCVWCGYDLTAEHIRRSGIKIGPREARQRIIKVVVDPNTAFKEIALIPDNVGGKRVLYGIGLMITFNMLAVFSKLDGLSFNDVTTIAMTLSYRQISISIPLKLILNIVFIIIQPLIFLMISIFVWKMGTRVLALFSRTVGGKADKEKIRAVIGYSLVPVLLGWTLAWLIRLLTPASRVSTPDSYSSVESALIGVTREGFGIVGMFFLWVGWLWATVLATIGMRHASKLSWVEAAIVAGIPYIAFMTIVL